MKKAIVTGATGAVGTALVKKLISEGVEVLVLVRKGGRVNKIPTDPLVKIAYCSLDEMADFQNENNEKYDAFFHLAWAGPYGKDRDDMLLHQERIGIEIGDSTLLHLLELVIGSKLAHLQETLHRSYLGGDGFLERIPWLGIRLVG